MNVVILHCHYQRGGVTQVVENHVAALAGVSDLKILLASGGRNDGLTPQTIQRCESIVIPELEYDDLQPSIPTAETIVARLRSALDASHLDFDDTVFHWHNPTLGKNVALPPTVTSLTRSFGARQFLQIHDFAEDFRPGNYQKLRQAAADVAPKPSPGTPEALVTSQPFNTYCYPNDERILYGTLTSGDQRVLQRLGLPDRRLRLIPNSVTLGEVPSPDPTVALQKVRRANGLPDDARWCLYPVRGIRRKNVGEFLLLSRLLPENVFAGITLPPATDIERRSYQRWKSVAERCAPRAVFDAGIHDGISFQENLQASDFVISTSVAEGFGMAFLEPWLAGRGVIARRLPNVADDFVASGVRLDRFYDSIWIPGTAEWASECRRETQAMFARAWAQLDPSLRPEWPEVACPANDAVDFATLTTERQMNVLDRISRDTGFAAEVNRINPDLIQSLARPFDASTLDANRSVIRTSFSLPRAHDQLLGIYQDLLDTPWHASQTPSVELSDESTLNILCQERTFFPCRTETEIAQ